MVGLQDAPSRASRQPEHVGCTLVQRRKGIPYASYFLNFNALLRLYSRGRIRTHPRKASRCLSKLAQMLDDFRRHGHLVL